MSEQIQGSISVCNQREFYLALTEKNILVVLSEFRRDHFTIDENLLNFYHEIRNIIKTQSNMYDVFSLTDEKFKKIITDRVGEISVNNLLALHDKKIKYGYKVFEQIPEKTLPSLIAQRNYQKIFIDRNQVELTEIVNSVTQLKRFPILAIFDGHDPVADKNMLEILDSKQGIYGHRYNLKDGGVSVRLVSGGAFGAKISKISNDLNFKSTIGLLSSLFTNI